VATRGQKIQVGLFLVIGSALIALAFVIVAGLRAEQQTPYFMEFNESILGLSKGSTVVYRGVPVGTVSDITVTDKYVARVQILVKPSKVKELHKGVTAQLVLQGLAAGTMCVSLDKSDPSQPVLPPGSMIDTEKSLVNEVSTQIAELLSSAREILDKFQSGMKGLHEGDIKQVIDHADELVQETRDLLATTNDTVNSIKGDAEAGVAGFRALTEDLRKLTKNADELVVTFQGKVKPLKLSETESDARNLLKSVNDLSEKLKKSVDTLDSVSKTVVNDTDNVQYSLRNILEQTAETMQSMHDVLEQLKQDPSSVVWGKGQPKGAK
jgi:phospholipid/cholesterol/gamma-HCH transport system substrate-binding protein